MRRVISQIVTRVLSVVFMMLVTFKLVLVFMITHFRIIIMFTFEINVVMRSVSVTVLHYLFVSILSSSFWDNFRV